MLVGSLGLGAAISLGVGVQIINLNTGGAVNAFHIRRHQPLWPTPLTHHDELPGHKHFDTGIA
jgi:hypothetical protein